MRGNDRYSTRCLLDELTGARRLQIGERSHQQARRLVDPAEVVGQEHGHLHAGEHPRVIAARGDRARPERAAPLGVVLLQVLRRLRRGRAREHPGQPRRQLARRGCDHAVPVSDAPLVAQGLAPEREHGARAWTGPGRASRRRRRGSEPRGAAGPARSPTTTRTDRERAAARACRRGRRPRSSARPHRCGSGAPERRATRRSSRGGVDRRRARSDPSTVSLPCERSSA
jgi:hypothetical protein